MRHGMSLIELILSIVVMGMVVMTLPLLLMQTQNNAAFSMQQEAILAAKQTVGSILTYYWDGRSFDENASFAYVLDVTAGDAELIRSQPDQNGTRRLGHINADNRRKFYDFTHPNKTAGAIQAGLEDINQFHNKNHVISLRGEDAKNLDYIMNLSLRTFVTYANDSTDYSQSIVNMTFNPADTGANSTNIKTIAVNIRNADTNESIITLRAFAYNIGEAALAHSRPYQ